MYIITFSIFALDFVWDWEATSRIQYENFQISRVHGTSSKRSVIGPLIWGWERLNHSCKIIITAGLRFTLAKGVLTTFFLMCPGKHSRGEPWMPYDTMHAMDVGMRFLRCPPVTRTYLMWDPDQPLETAALFEPWGKAGVFFLPFQGSLNRWCCWFQAHGRVIFSFLGAALKLTKLPRFDGKLNWTFWSANLDMDGPGMSTRIHTQHLIADPPQ